MRADTHVGRYYVPYLSAVTFRLQSTHMDPAVCANRTSVYELSRKLREAA